jgi:hypothetical protein
MFYSLWKSASKLSRGCSNAGDHHFDGNRAQSYSTTTLPCPMDGPVASSLGWAAYHDVALMYFLQQFEFENSEKIRTWHSLEP